MAMERLLKPDPVRFSPLTIFFFLLYLLLVGLGVRSHEPWLDEVHPWMMAQDEKWGVIFLERLHWDAHPGLWYFLLKLWATFLPGNGLALLAYGFGALNAALYLFSSRLPIWVRVGFVFSYFFFYQNPVVARSYGLYPLLFWWLMRMGDRRRQKPWELGLVLALISSVSVHGMVIGAGFWLAVIAEGFLQKIHVLKERTFWISLTLHSSAVLFWAYCLLPVHQMVPQEKGISWGALEALSTLFSASAGVTLGIILFFVFCLDRLRLLLWALLPVGLLLGMFLGLYYAPWHEGILYSWWAVFLVWAFPKLQKLSLSLQKSFVLVLMLIFLVQVKWSAVAWVHDLKGSFSGSKEAAEYIQSAELVPAGIDGYGHFDVTVNAYFPENIFSNRGRFPKRYYSWDYPRDLAYPTDWSRVKGAPTILVHQTDEAVLPVAIQGYRFVRRFKGKVFWKDTFALEDNYDLYRRQE
jgi:hypothetical protein